jgi:hypothetical protein
MPGTFKIEITVAVSTFGVSVTGKYAQMCSNIMELFRMNGGKQVSN